MGRSPAPRQEDLPKNFLLALLNGLDDGLTVYDMPASGNGSVGSPSSEGREIVFENRQAKEFREMGVSAPCLTTVQKEIEVQPEGGGGSPQKFWLEIRADPSKSRLLKTCMEAIPEISFFADPHTGGLFFVSKHWERVTGTEIEDTGKGFSWARLLHPDDVVPSVVAWRESVMSGKTYEREFRLLKKEGGDPRDVLYMRGRAGHVRNAHGVPILVAGVTSDISEVVETKELLAREKSFLMTSLDSVPVSVVIAKKDRSGRCPIVFANEETLKIWRHPHLKLSGDIPSYSEWIGYRPDGSRMAGEEWPLARSITHGDIIKGEDHIYGRGDGTKGIVRLTSAPVRDPKTGEILGGVVSCEDVTDKLQAEQDKAARSSAEQAAAQMQMMLANVSHEVRTPIAGVIGLASLLSDTELDPEQKELVDGIKESGQLLLVVISDLLDHSKIKAGKMALEKKPFCLYSVVRHVLSLTSEVARTKGLRLVTFLHPTLPKAIVHSDLRLKQVFLNLLSNATKFTPYGGTINIEGYAEHVEVPNQPEASTPAASSEGDDTNDQASVGMAPPSKQEPMGPDDALSLRRPMMTEALPTITSREVTGGASTTSRDESRTSPVGKEIRDLFIASTRKRSSSLSSVTSAGSFRSAASSPVQRSPVVPQAPPQRNDSGLPVLSIAPRRESEQVNQRSLTGQSPHVGKEISSALLPGDTVTASPLASVLAQKQGKGKTQRRAYRDFEPQFDPNQPSLLNQPLTQAPKPGTWARLFFSIRDTGIGLTESQMSRLFKPFVQADASTTRKYGGTGLGLALCHDLLGLMDGKITVESAGEGKGTCFRFDFVAEVADPETVDCALEMEGGSKAAIAPFGDVKRGDEKTSWKTGGIREIITPGIGYEKHDDTESDEQSNLLGVVRSPQPRQPSAAFDHGKYLGKSLSLPGNTAKDASRPQIALPTKAASQQPSSSVMASCACCVNHQGGSQPQGHLHHQHTTFDLSGIRPSSPRTLGLSIGLAQVGHPNLLSASGARSGSSNSNSAFSGLGERTGSVLDTRSSSAASHTPSPLSAREKASLAAPGLEGRSRSFATGNHGGGAAVSSPLARGARGRFTFQHDVEGRDKADVAPDASPPLLLFTSSAGAPAPALFSSSPSAPASASGASAGAKAAATSIRPHRILVVDDNAVNRSLATRFLKKLDFGNIEVACDGAEAVEAIKGASSPSAAQGDRKGYFSLVLMDLMMPVLGGAEATQAIRALDDKRAASVPIVALTAASSAEKTRYASLFDGYLSKPYTLKELGDALEQAFATRQPK